MSPSHVSGLCPEGNRPSNCLLLLILTIKFCVCYLAVLSFPLQGDKDLFASNTATSIYWLSHLALNSLLTFLSFSLSLWRPPIHLVITSHFFASIVPPVFFLKAWIIVWVSIFFSSGMWTIQQLNYCLVPGTVCGQHSMQAGDPLQPLSDPISALQAAALDHSQYQIFNKVSMRSRYHSGIRGVQDLLGGNTCEGKREPSRG